MHLAVSRIRVSVRTTMRACPPPPAQPLREVGGLLGGGARSDDE